MNWIENITSENFEESFDLIKILENSTFYPASGIDATNIEGLSQYSKSFVHVDYSVSKSDVRKALIQEFIPVGYKMIGLKLMEKDDLTPNGFSPNNFPLKQSEKERINFLNNPKNNHKSFCFWAIYELDDSLSNKTDGKIKKFSLLHVGGEACATFDALYVNNGINPTAIAILNPSEGYGDNWTKFSDPDYRLFQLLQLNLERNKTSLPEYIFTNMTSNEECFWPNYNFLNKGEYLRPNGDIDNCFTYKKN
jgi:hypothetical protein